MSHKIRDHNIITAMIWYPSEPLEHCTGIVGAVSFGPRHLENVYPLVWVNATILPIIIHPITSYYTHSSHFSEYISRSTSVRSDKPHHTVFWATTICERHTSKSNKPGKLRQRFHHVTHQVLRCFPENKCNESTILRCTASSGSAADSSNVLMA